MKNIEDNFGRIIEVIKLAKSIAIGTHSNPDGDTIGSAIALLLFLRKLGKEDIYVYNRDGVPYNLKFLPSSDSFSRTIPDKQFDLVIVVDVGDLERVSEDFAEKLRYEKSIVIDHHLTVTGFGDLKIIDPDAAATGVLVFKLINFWNKGLMDKEIATALYTAIMTDTGSFRFSNTNPTVLRIAAELVEIGVSPHKIAAEVYENFPFEKVRLLAAVLATLTYDPRGKWAYIVVTRDILLRTGATPDMLEDIINYVRGISGVKVAMQFREIDSGVFKVGFRSRGVDVEKIARLFGGGGHKNASGCKIKGEYPEIVERVIKEVEKVI